MSVDCIVADDNTLLDFLSIKNLNLNLNGVRFDVEIIIKCSFIYSK